MRSVDDHVATVLAGVSPLEPLDVQLLEARGCLLAEAVTAPWPLPGFDSAAVDGYAVRSQDCSGATRTLPAQLRVVDDVPAGYRATRPVAPGQAIRMMAGAPLPVGADAVVDVERTDAGMPTVSVLGPLQAGEGVRRAGEDVAQGQVVVEEGALVGAREVALLAAVGRARVSVRPKPRVVVISTGTELVEPGAALSPGLVADSNGYMLTAAAQDAGAVAFRAGPVPDEQRALTDTLEDQLVRADLIVTTGGVAVGTYDTLRTVLDRLGAVEFTRVAMTPGMPQGHGHLGPDAVPIFTLPGNPASAFVSFEVFVRPVIRRMLGHAQVTRPLRSARLTAPVTGRPGVRTYVRARLDGRGEGLTATPVTDPGLVGLRLADCLVVLPEGAGLVAAGTPVSIMPVGA